jgi:hypothetical protein
MTHDDEGEVLSFQYIQARREKTRRRSQQARALEENRSVRSRGKREERRERQKCRISEFYDSELVSSCFDILT